VPKVPTHHPRTMRAQLRTPPRGPIAFVAGVESAVRVANIPCVGPSRKQEKAALLPRWADTALRIVTVDLLVEAEV
jgi:hypothetical protein